MTRPDSDLRDSSHLKFFPFYLNFPAVEMSVPKGYNSWTTMTIWKVANFHEWSCGIWKVATFRNQCFLAINTRESSDFSLKIFWATSSSSAQIYICVLYCHWEIRWYHCFRYQYSGEYNRSILRKYIPMHTSDTEGE